MFPSALPARRETTYNAWVTIQIGCDNNCAFCIVPAVRGAEISRPFADVVAEVAAARRRGRHRGDAARPERQQLRPRPAARGPPGRRRPARACARCSPTCCARSAPSTASAAFASPARTPRTCGRDVRGHGRRRPPCASTSTTRCSRAATGCWRRCTAATPPSATSNGSPTRAAPLPTWRCRPTSSSASRARPTTTSQRTLEVAAAAEYDYAYTFIFSPRPGTEAADDDRSLRRPSRRRRAIPPTARRRRAQRARQARGAGRAHRGGARRGPEQEGPGGARRSHPAEQARALHAADPVARRQPTPRSRSPAAPRTISPGRFVELLAEPAHKVRIPVAAP